MSDMPAVTRAELRAENALLKAEVERLKAEKDVISKPHLVREEELRARLDSVTLQVKTIREAFAVSSTQREKDLELQKDKMHIDLMRLMTAIGPYSTVESAAKFATETRRQWSEYRKALERMAHPSGDMHDVGGFVRFAREVLGQTEKRVAPPYICPHGNVHQKGLGSCADCREAEARHGLAGH